MEIEKEELIFERAFDKEALSSFDCGVREINLLIHKEIDGLNDYLKDNNYESFIVYSKNVPVAVFVYRTSQFEIEEGAIDAIEIEFIAVRQEYQRKGIGKIIVNKISEYAVLNKIFILKVGAFFNKRYSAEEFYIKCKFEHYSDRKANIIPMFKELDPA